MALCVDLKEMFGRRYRVGRDPAASPSSADPWMWTITSRRATVYPFDDRRVAVELIGRRPQIAALLRQNGYALYQDGDDGKTFLVPADDLDRLAKLLALPKRWHLSPERRAKALLNLSPGGSGGYWATGTHRTVRDDPEAVSRLRRP